MFLNFTENYTFQTQLKCMLLHLSFKPYSMSHISHMTPYQKLCPVVFYLITYSTETNNNNITCQA